MSQQMYEVVITAEAEVRDAEGNLISSSPVESRQLLTEDQVRDLMGGGRPDPGVAPIQKAADESEGQS